MRALLAISLLVTLSVLLCECSIFSDSPNLNQELFHYRNRVRAVYQLLLEECPDEVKIKWRATDENAVPTNLEVEKLYYNALVQKLIECRKRNQENQRMKERTTTMKSTTTAKQTTTTPSKPVQCLSATNLIESWRMDHDGKNLKAGGPNAESDGRACDFRRELQWFRFTGAAGTQLLNKCPKAYSCGTGVAMWTDVAMPTAVGVPTNITVYGSESYDYSSRCRVYTIQVEVMRCSMSTDHDFIYRYTGSNSRYSTDYPHTCAFAFCGMM